MCDRGGSFGYTSVKYIEVYNWRLSALYYVLMAGILAFVVVVQVYLSKGYQAFESVVGTTSAKVKGSAYINPDYPNWNDNADGNGDYDWKVFTSDDLVKPPLEANALFITTALLETAQQVSVDCTSYTNKTGVCSQGSSAGDCPNGTPTFDAGGVPSSYGVTNGVCGENGFCNVRGWCPLENDTLAKDNTTTLFGVEDWTIFFKENVVFPLFNVSLTNALNKDGNGAPVPGYNLFTLADILEKVNTTIADVRWKGAIILAQSDWTCDLDLGSNRCTPQYSFSRIDNLAGTISPGYNFRSSEILDNENSRILRKYVGVRIVYSMTGRAGKFDFATTGITLGSGLALLSLSALVTDFFLKYCCRKSEVYKSEKYQELAEDLFSPKASMDHAKYAAAPGAYASMENGDRIDDSRAIHDGVCNSFRQALVHDATQDSQRGEGDPQTLRSVSPARGSDLDRQISKI